MRKRTGKRRFAQPLCAETSPDDGLDPREWARDRSGPIANRKAMQLCRQVERTLMLVLAGLADPVLNDLLVQQVQPFPDSTRLLITVCSATGGDLAAEAVGQRLVRLRPLLRQEVARSIHRRRTPDLVFRIGSIR